MKIKSDGRERPFSRLSNTKDLTLYLIRRELRATKFTNALGQLGFDHSVFASDLGMAILSLVGIKERTDELWIWYFERLDWYAEQINLQDHSGDQGVARDFWEELRGRRY